MGKSLRIRSSRAPTAGHQARHTGTVYIFCVPGLASHRRCQLSSNVRLRKNKMLCRCFRPPSAPVKGPASAEPARVLNGWPPSDEFIKALSVPAAHTSLGAHGATWFRLLLELEALAFANRSHFSNAQSVHMARIQGRPRQCSLRRPASPPTATQFRHSTVRRAEPNPSFKPSPNGGSRWPSSAGPAAHFALAVQHAPPSVPA